MIKVCAARLIALLFVTVCTPAISQEFKTPEVRKITHKYAECVVHKQHKLASEVILGDVNTGVIQKKFQNLIIGECLESSSGSVAGPLEAKFTDDLYRYALADALVNADFASSGPMSFDDRLPLAHIEIPQQSQLDAALASTKGSRKRDEMKLAFARQVLVAWLSRYGECIVRQDPVGSRYWLLTKPDVPEELSRINALRPAFTNCLDGGTFKFGKVVLRGVVALNYYRLAMATQHPSLGKSK